MKNKVAKKVKKYHLLMYVYNSSPKLKKFSSPKEMAKFIEDFEKKHPDYLASNSGNWIDFCVMNVSGPVHFFTDGIEVE